MPLALRIVVSIMARVRDRWLKRDRKTRTAEYGVGLRWQAVWDEPGGQERKKSFATKDAAADYVLGVQSEIRSGTYHPKGSGAVTVGEWAEVWYTAQVHQREGLQETIRRRMDRNIIPTLGSVQLSELNRADIQAAIAVWSRTLALSTVKTTCVYLAGMLKQVVIDKQLKASPTAGVNLPKVERAPVRPLSVATVQALVNVMGGGVP
ncbi:hypothetical protein NG702_15075 [Pseudarthrobacter sp. MDT3-28]|uniref:hypothetical protein n=1 Tax=Pseudarthrobacter raffinosi TaxID=2953651 RepID=UPI00208EA1E3|nr:hypothetical protein [Pseudarthrobacter sp. MDT3-28]MCO4238717.1 hypothetical protein [Pseudarthrobacter sp. MDT3-28]